MFLICGLIAMSGCANKQVSATYWTTKAGVVTVHHVTGRLDSTEKLIDKQLSATEVKTAGLPKGKYFSVLEGHAAVVSPTPSPKKKEPQKTDALADVASQLKELKREVREMQVENQQLNTSSGKAPPAVQETVQAELQQQDVRVSQ
jgi:hypothetical protein